VERYRDELSVECEYVLMGERESSLNFLSKRENVEEKRNLEEARA